MLVQTLLVYVLGIQYTYIVVVSVIISIDLGKG